jgi:hypothetical protein
MVLYPVSLDHAGVLLPGGAARKWLQGLGRFIFFGRDCLPASVKFTAETRRKRIMENMGPDLYQVDATMPAGTTQVQFQRMMQELLMERFHLAVLTSLGRGMVRVQRNREADRTVAGGDPTDFAARKARVIDKMGLTGKYDFTLEFACQGCRGLGANMAMANGVAADSPASAESGGSGLPNVFVAVEKQIGLKLVKTKDLPLEVIVVDRVGRVPTGN